LAQQELPEGLHLFLLPGSFWYPGFTLAIAVTNDAENGRPPLHGAMRTDGSHGRQFLEEDVI